MRSMNWGCAATLIAASLPATAAGPYYAYRLEARHDSRGFAAVALNASGQVAGSVWADGIRAVSSGPNGQGVNEVRTSRDPGYLAWATGITDDGQVVGTLRSPFSSDAGFYTGRRARLWTPVLVPVWAARAIYTGVSGNGWATGYASQDVSYYKRAILGELKQAAPVELGTLGGSQSWGNAVDNSGRVVGASYTGVASSPVQAFITGPKGISMKAVESTPSYSSEAFAISDTGWVAGTQQLIAGGVTTAFVFHPTIGVRALGLTPGAEGSASGVDAEGRVVGNSQLPTVGLTAFVTEAGGGEAVDLNTVTQGLPRRERLSYAFAINARGQISAATHDGHAYLLCPTVDCQ
jgi:hypothetical protein